MRVSDPGEPECKYNYDQYRPGFKPDRSGLSDITEDHRHTSRSLFPLPLSSGMIALPD
jgi:hypothetical protein